MPRSSSNTQSGSSRSRRNRWLLPDGTGHYTTILHDNGARVCARDSSPTMVRYLTRRLEVAGITDIDVNLGRFPDDLRSNEDVRLAVTNAGLLLTHGPVNAGVTAVYRCETAYRLTQGEL